MILVADVGGTNTRLALAETAGGRLALRPDSARRFLNADFADLAAVIARYRMDYGPAGAIRRGAIAVAGPVSDGRCRLTNLDWHLAESALAADLGGPVRLLNDLQAQGHALAHLPRAAVQPLIPGAGASADRAAPRLVIGIGTGFNIALVLPQAAARSNVPPAEAGHVSLPVETAEDLDRAAWLRPRAGGFASVEEALSGRGLENLYLWRAGGRMDEGGKRSEQILAALRTGTDPLAVAAMRDFTRLLGSVTGNLALTLLPRGGIYLTGGMARAVAPWLLRFGFAEALCVKGRFAPLLAQFPISVIGDDGAALLGAAAAI